MTAEKHIEKLRAELRHGFEEMCELINSGAPPAVRQQLAATFRSNIIEISDLKAGLESKTYYRQPDRRRRRKAATIPERAADEVEN